jgi:hypothetical protein
MQQASEDGISADLTVIFPSEGVFYREELQGVLLKMKKALYKTATRVFPGNE